MWRVPEMKKQKDECIARQESVTRGMRRKVCVMERAGPSSSILYFCAMVFWDEDSIELI